MTTVVDALAARQPADRAQQIIDILVEAFEPLIKADSAAFRAKFRKMAADPFAFYRGSACLFFADVTDDEDPWADQHTSRVWIQGDLHCGNFGTYMDSSGVLVFDVNDYDEAYLGHYTWDLKRLVASLALLGFGKALSDETIATMSYRIKDVVGRSGFGIGSAGLPAYNLLMEGATQALENDVVLSMKQGNVAAASRVVDDPGIRQYFEHQGHRTAVSQRALQAHADPWLGWCTLDGVGQVVQELSPYETDIEWADINEPSDIMPLLRYLGQAVAKVHCVSDADSVQSLVPFQTENAIVSAIGDRDDEFAADLVAFGLGYAARVRHDHRYFVDSFRNGQVPGV